MILVCHFVSSLTFLLFPEVELHYLTWLPVDSVSGICYARPVLEL